MEGSQSSGKYSPDTVADCIHDSVFDDTANYKSEIFTHKNFFQGVPRSKTWVCCTSTSNYLHSTYFVFKAIYMVLGWK